MWHDVVVRAARESAEDHGFIVLEPGDVFLRSDGRHVRYRPDALLLRQGRDVHAVVVEAENIPSGKAVPGDIILAALVKTRFAEMFPYADLGIGSALRRDRVLKDIYDARRRGQVIRAEERTFLRGDSIGALDFILAVRDRDSRNYYGRYLELLLQMRWGVAKPFGTARCIECSGGSVSAAKRTLGRVLAGLYQEGSSVNKPFSG